MQAISGSSASVFTGSFSMDYMLQLTRDPEDPPPYAAVGFGLSMLANRISWFFNLRGPSIGLDSACSSTATAIDVACQSLRDGSTSMVCLSVNFVIIKTFVDILLGHGCRCQFSQLPGAVYLDVER